MLDDVDQEDSTALHLAAEKGSIIICEILMRHGTNPNAAKKSGTTPLHIAAKIGNKDLCAALQLVHQRKILTWKYFFPHYYLYSLVWFTQNWMLQMVQ